VGVFLVEARRGPEIGRGRGPESGVLLMSTRLMSYAMVRRRYVESARDVVRLERGSGVD
jgi:hypothetical protein